MPRKPKRGRPKPFAVGEVRVRVVRGPRQGRWYWRAEDHKTRATVWTGWAKKSEAIEAVSAIRAEGKPEPQRKGKASSDEIITIEDLLDVWLGAQLQRADLRPRSKEIYEWAVLRIRKVVGHVHIKGYSRLTTEILRNTLLQSYAPRTVSLDIGRLKTAWTWGRGLGLVPPRDFPNVQVKVPTTPKYTPSDAEILRVIEHIRIPWRRVMLCLHYATGARLDELARLRWDDVDLEEGVLHIAGKTGPRWVPIPPTYVRMLLEFRELPRAGHGFEYVLGVLPNAARVNMQRGINEACEAAGVRRFTTHALRRAVVDRMARSGIDIATAAAITGHSPSVMLRFYRQPTRADVRAAVTKARLGALTQGEVVEFPRAVGETHQMKRTRASTPDDTEET